MSAFNEMEAFTKEELDILDGILLEGAMPISGTTSGASAQQEGYYGGATYTDDDIDNIADNILNETEKACEKTAREYVDTPKTEQTTRFSTGKDYFNEVNNDEVNQTFNNQIHTNEQAEKESVNTENYGKGANFSDYSTTQAGHQKRQTSYRSSNTNEQAENPIMYQKNSFTDEDGNNQQYMEVAMKVDTSKFDFDFESDSEESAIYNVDTLKALYSNIVKKKVGGFNRVTSINVTNGRVIFNKTIYVKILPSSERDIIHFREHLPVDLYMYIEQGMTGYFFDWSLLLSCSNLKSLVFDDYEFFSDIVIVELNMPFYIGKLFDYLEKLEFLKMGEYEYTYDSIQAIHEDIEEKRKTIALAREQSFFGRAKEYFRKSTFDYGRLSPTTWTDKLDNHFHMCFKDYLKNRGKKGLIRYTGGVLIRGIFAAASTLLNAGTHFVGDSISYARQYKPRVVYDPNWNIKSTEWDYQPNARTEGEKPKYTSGDEVTNHRTEYHSNNSKNSSSDKDNKNSKRKVSKARTNKTNKK